MQAVQLGRLFLCLLTFANRPDNLKARTGNVYGSPSEMSALLYATILFFFYASRTRTRKLRKMRVWCANLQGGNLTTLAENLAFARVRT